MDGSSGQHIEASKADISSGSSSCLCAFHFQSHYQNISLHESGFLSPEKSWVSPTHRYAVVPSENVSH